MAAPGTSGNAYLPNSLSDIARIVGFLVSWATTIYFVWNRKTKTATGDLADFPLVRQLTIVVITVFLAISWGSLGTADGITVLRILAVVLTILGIGILFTTTYFSMRLMPIDPKHRSFVALLFLLGFFLYSSAISCGLTSAGEFVTFLVLNPANNRIGLTFGAPAVYAVTLHVRGLQTISVARVAGQPEPPIVPFARSSGEINFVCGERREPTVQVALPEGTTLVGTPTVAWRHVSNVSSPPQYSLQMSGRSVVGSGLISGLQYQDFGLGIRNCPGGGHGELVVSGNYRPAPLPPRDQNTTQVQDAATPIKSKLDQGASVPDWISLPDYTISFIRADFQSETNPQDRAELTVSPDRPSVSQGEYLLVYDQNGNRAAIMVRSWWQALRARLRP